MELVSRTQGEQAEAPTIESIKSQCGLDIREIGCLSLLFELADKVVIALGWLEFHGLMMPSIGDAMIQKARSYLKNSLRVRVGK